MFKFVHIRKPFYGGAANLQAAAFAADLQKVGWVDFCLTFGGPGLPGVLLGSSREAFVAFAVHWAT